MQFQFPIERGAERANHGNGHLDWAAARLAAAIEHVAIALAEPDEAQRILPTGEALVRVRP